jgi:predicted methyltransferase
MILAIRNTALRSWNTPWVFGLLLVAGCGREPAAPAQPAANAPTAATAPAAEAVEPTAPVAAAPSAAIAAAVANPARPADDVARDAERKPAETLAFYDVQPGQVVLEFVAGGGYFTELLSRTVGDTGRVVATREEPKRIADGRLPNVTAAADTEWGLAPDSVDLIFTAQNYHDVVNLKVERPPLLANFLTVLKPGGIFAVIDHSAESGSADRDVGTLHRIDEALVVSEIEAAGFELVESSDLLRNPSDTRTLKVFDPAIRGKTDCFVLKFRKPLATAPAQAGI